MVQRKIWHIQLQSVTLVFNFTAAGGTTFRKLNLYTLEMISQMDIHLFFTKLSYPSVVLKYVLLLYLGPSSMDQTLDIPGLWLLYYTMVSGWPEHLLFIEHNFQSAVLFWMHCLCCLTLHKWLFTNHDYLLIIPTLFTSALYPFSSAILKINSKQVKEKFMMKHIL